MRSVDLFAEVSRPENFELVKGIINTMEYDPVIGPLLMDLLNKQQAETRTFIYWAAKHLQAKRYLEIGTRRGWSLGMVCSAVPECDVYCFDWWEKNYSSCPNPGPEFVSSEMKKIGYQKEVHFINGDSHITVPQFFQENTEDFDLILVDGDHTVDGAFDDLKNTMPHVRNGGILIFDDIVIVERLDEVFHHLKKMYPNFEYHAYIQNGPGVGIAIRNT
jgi:predicted O-methyltransferase YrrM